MLLCPCFIEYTWLGLKPTSNLWDLIYWCPEQSNVNGGHKEAVVLEVMSINMLNGGTHNEYLRLCCVSSPLLIKGNDLDGEVDIMCFTVRN